MTRWLQSMIRCQLWELYDDLALMKSMKRTVEKTIKLPQEVALSFVTLLLCMDLFMLCSLSLSTGQYSAVAVVGIISLNVCATVLGMHEYYEAVRIARNGEELIRDIEVQEVQIRNRIWWLEMKRDLELRRQKNGSREGGDRRDPRRYGGGVRCRRTTLGKASARCFRRSAPDAWRSWSTSASIPDADPRRSARTSTNATGRGWYAC